jgi:hypothetical protein
MGCCCASPININQDDGAASLLIDLNVPFEKCFRFGLAVNALFEIITAKQKLRRTVKDGLDHARWGQRHQHPTPQRRG